mgnify:CR=1 FL=1
MHYHFSWCSQPIYTPFCSLEPYVYLGCYRDTKERAVPEFLGIVDSADECSAKAKNNYYEVYNIVMEKKTTDLQITINKLCYNTV